MVQSKIRLSDDMLPHALLSVFTDTYASVIQFCRDKLMHAIFGNGKEGEKVRLESPQKVGRKIPIMLLMFHDVSHAQPVSHSGAPISHDSHVRRVALP